MGREDQRRLFAAFFRQPAERRTNPIDCRLNKARMVVETANHVDLRGIHANSLPGSGDIFAILPTTRIGTKGRSHKGQGMFDAVVGHLPDNVAQHGVPVPVSPIDGQMGSMFIKFYDQLGKQPGSPHSKD